MGNKNNNNNNNGNKRSVSVHRNLFLEDIFVTFLFHVTSGGLDCLQFENASELQAAYPMLR
jgi:hypothetical protein